MMKQQNPGKHFDGHRAATPADAAVMARLVDIAGEGMPRYLWAKIAADNPGMSVWDIGAQRAQRESGAFSYRNTILAEADGSVVAGLIGYPLPEIADPARFDDLPPMFVALQELEDLVPGTWYINVLATEAEQRGKGYGQALLANAEHLARSSGCQGLSLIVNDANDGARRLYGRNGYLEVARRPMIKENWENPGTEWILLQKPF